MIKPLATKIMVVENAVNDVDLDLNSGAMRNTLGKFSYEKNYD
jgi:hypothetical protein